MITLNINGKTARVDAEPDTPLLWVLRDTLRLTSTKYGCGEGVGSSRVGEAVQDAWRRLDVVQCG